MRIDESKALRLKLGDAQQLKSLLTTLFEIDTSPVPQRQAAGSSSLLKLDAISDSMIEAGSDQPPKSLKSKRSSEVGNT